MRKFYQQLNIKKITLALFMLVNFAIAGSVSAQYWVQDPALCPAEYKGQECTNEVICGIYANDFIECYDDALLSFPIATTTVTTTDPTGNDTGGFWLDCYDIDNESAVEPFCNNNDSWWCNYDPTCSSKNVKTDCIPGGTDFECNECFDTHIYCDGSLVDADGCEVQTGVSSCATVVGGTDEHNNVTGTSGACGCSCDVGYLDCNNDDDAVFGGSDADTSTGNCEVQTDVSACDVLGGVYNDEHNSVDGSCDCQCDVNYLDCNNDDADAIETTGNCELHINYDFANHWKNIDCSTTQCAADYLDCDGDGTGSDGDCEVHNGEACVTPYGAAGTIMACGGCVADVVPFETGTEAKYATTTPLLWGTQYGTGPLMKLTSYMASTTGGVFFIDNGGQVGIGTSTSLGTDNLLTVGIASGTQFIVNKVGVVTAGTWNGAIIGVDFGGTGTSTWAINGIVFADSDNHLSQVMPGGNGQVLSLNGSGVPTWSDVSGVAHPLLSSSQHPDTEDAIPNRGDLIIASSTGSWDSLALGPNGYILYSDNIDAAWESFAGLFASEFAATNTDALVEGSMNKYYHTSLFAADLAATTTLPNILALAGLSQVGTIATGTWQADLIDVAYGGTGWNSTGETGFAYLDSGVWSASSTLSGSLLDPKVMIEGESLDLLDNTISQYIKLTSLSSTADAVTYNNTNGQFSVSALYEIPLIASTSDWNLAYNNVDTNSLNWDTAYGWGNHATFGYFSTTSAGILNVKYGGTGTSTEHAQGSIIFAGQNGIYSADNGNFFWDDMNNRLGIGTTTPDRDLTIDGDMDITGTIYPSGMANVGSAINRFQDGYFVNLDVQNMTMGSTSISGAAGNSFTINSDNGTADLEDSSLIFSRGVTAPDAQILWNASEDTIMFNFPIGLENQSALKFYESIVNGTHYASFSASSTLSSDLNWILPTEQGMIGDSLMLDTAGNMVWENSGEILDGTIGQLPFYAGAGRTLTGTSSIFLETTTGNFGVGTSTPLARLDVYGNFILSGQNRYLNFAASSGEAGYGMRDFNGQIEVKSRNGDWAAIGSGAESLAGLNDTEVTGVNFGDILYRANSGKWEALATSSLNVALSNTTGTLAVNRGGTGLSSPPSYGQLLLGNNSNGYTLVSTSSLGLAELSNPGTEGFLPFFASDGRSLTATSVIYIDTSTGFVGIATTTPGRQLTVQGQGQFTELCLEGGSCISNWNAAGSLDSLGTISAGQVAVWTDPDTFTGSSTLSTNVGGTGKSEWTPLSIPYLSGTTTFSEITMGPSSYLLAVNATNDGYDWVEASSTGVVLSQEEVDTYIDALINDPQAVHDRITITYDDVDNAMDFQVDDDLNNYDWVNIGPTHLTSARGGTGWDSSASTGLAIIANGVWSATNTLSALRLDSRVMVEGESLQLLDNTLTQYITLVEARAGLDATGAPGIDYNNTTGTFTINSNYLIPLVSSTTNWNNTHNLVTLNSSDWDTSYSWGNHATYGYFSTTSAGVLEVQYGGTGTTTFEQNSLLYATAADTVGEILAGGDGQILKSENGVPTWVATSSLGIDFSDVGGMLDTTHGGTGTSTDAWTGFAYVDSGTWIASNTISLANLDPLVMVEGEDIDLLTNNAGYITWASLQSNAAGLLYNNSNGEFTLDGDYNIPLTASTTNWNDTFNTITLSSSDWNWTYEIMMASSTLWQNTFETVNAGASNWGDAYAWGNHANFGYFSTTSAGILDVEYGGTGTSTWQAGSLVYSPVQNSLSELLAGAEGQVLVIKNGQPYWSATSSGAKHPLLGSEHNDVTAAAVQRGDLIIGTSTPTTSWARLALGPDGYILRSDGTDLTWSTTTNITALGTVLVGRWEADVIDLAFGGTGATTATGARENLGLTDVHKFGINATGTDGFVWKSDGDGRGEWVATSSLNIGSSQDRVSKLIGTTSVAIDGHFATTTPEGSFEGYTAANILCDYEFPGSHFCRTYDILVSAEQDDISAWAGKVWVAEGPPGFTSNSNDCQGWTSNAATHLGAWWDLDPNGGKGWLVSCDYTRPLSCCAR